MTVELNKEDFIRLAIQNCHPQVHGSRWTTDEDNILHESIQKSLSLEDISKIIKLRSHSAIYTRANSLGFAYKRNNDDGLTYFHTEINHKNRRTMKEIMEGKESASIPIESTDSTGTDIEVTNDSIPEKIEIDIVDFDIIIHILTVTREKAVAARITSRGGSLYSLTEILPTKDMYVS